METILEVREKFKAEHIVDILKGNETSDIKTYQHDELENFASATDEDEKLLHAVIRQALIAGYISKDIENYGLLKLTPAGKAFIKSPKPFPVVKDTEFEDDDEDAVTKTSGGTCAADDVLFSILKDLRKKMSKKLDVPPFVIFQDPSLEAMATTYPITMEELQNIPGVGSGKAKRYGEDFLKVIKEHVKENEIIRPEDLRVRTVPNKSKLKVSIIQSIDRKIALDDIAMAKGLEINELLDEIEAIVYSGTKINIDYFLDEIMDPDRVDEIFEYFRTAETDKIEPALRELGEDDFSETEIRLVRIKFLSEIGN
ncbi:MAG: ATP-dependent DNA helicase RecQ [Bacteroidetes bacterium ADurb.BinA395]|nr:MAG: ATP-dependent DNA helicase RecQ [Bacteroidetes bacterium ADurb.BinA395]